MDCEVDAACSKKPKLCPCHASAAEDAVEGVNPASAHLQHTVFVAPTTTVLAASAVGSEPTDSETCIAVGALAVDEYHTEPATEGKASGDCFTCRILHRP
jgi:hypothetical protein